MFRMEAKQNAIWKKMQEISSLQLVEESPTAMNAEGESNTDNEINTPTDTQSNSKLDISYAQSIEKEDKHAETIVTDDVMGTELAQKIENIPGDMNVVPFRNDKKMNQIENTENHKEDSVPVQTTVASNNQVVDIEIKQNAQNENTENGMSSLELAIYRADDNYASDGDDEVSSSSDSDTR